MAIGWGRAHAGDRYRSGFCQPAPYVQQPEQCRSPVEALDRIVAAG
jgi:hypothetical protein